MLRSTAVLFVVLAACADPGAEPVVVDPGDAGAEPADAGTSPPTCQPACTAPGTACVEGACACASANHDGGDGSCVPEGTCAPGFGLRAGENSCRPVAEVCAPALCLDARQWSQERCEYAVASDGTSCAGQSADSCVTQFECRTGQCTGVAPACGARRPLVLVHGINGSSANFAVMKQRLIADGWPEAWIYLFDAKDPKWGCNVDNAEAIRLLVQKALKETCQPRVDIVAHSMGTLSSRNFMKNLGGAEVVNTYVTLGGPHHGLASPCYAPGFLGVCVWRELCESGDYVKQLNAPPAIVGSGPWVSIYGTGDTTIPNASSHLEGAENIAMPGVEHAGALGLNEDAATYAEVLRVLRYPCW